MRRRPPRSTRTDTRFPVTTLFRSHFDSDAAREPRGWMLGSTSRLPQAVCVRWYVPVADDFSARFSARARRYRYSILNRSEEHTSELQSLMRISYAVFCLKKKK